MTSNLLSIEYLIPIASLFILHAYRHQWGANLIQKYFESTSEKNLKINEKSASEKQVKFEKLWTSRSQYIDLGVIVFIGWLISIETLEVNFIFEEFSISKSILVTTGLFLAQDLYFYFTHRAMHHPLLFEKVHMIHHRSILPSVWSSFSVHPVEKFVELIFFPAMIVFIPMHIYTVLIFIFLSTTINFMGHSGHEFRWKPGMGKFHLSIFSTTLFHDLHHRRPNSNFALYFTVWDRLLGTQFSKYNQQLEAKMS